MRISDWSSDVCSSDLDVEVVIGADLHAVEQLVVIPCHGHVDDFIGPLLDGHVRGVGEVATKLGGKIFVNAGGNVVNHSIRSEESRVGKECGSTCRSGLATYN